MSEIVTLAILSGQLIKAPFISGGISLLDITVVLFNLYGITRLKDSKNITIPLHIKSILLFLLICLISLIFTPLHLTTNEYLISFSYIARITFYTLFAYLYSQNCFPQIQAKIYNLLIYSGVGLAFLGILQYIFLPDLKFLSQEGWDPHYFRTVSTFLDPNFAGAFFTLTLILFLSKNKLNKKYIGLFLITFLALLTTFSRSSYLMFLLGGITLSFLNRSKITFMKIVVLFCILIAGFNIYTQLISKPRNISREQSASYRLNTWQQGIELFKTHPILGVGFNSYKFALKEYHLGDEQFLSSHGATSNDSSLLFVAATTGIIGLVFYVYFLFTLLRNTSSQYRNILISSIGGLLLHSIFANSLFFPPIFLWIMLTASTPKK